MPLHRSRLASERDLSAVSRRSALSFAGPWAWRSAPKAAEGSTREGSAAQDLSSARTQSHKPGSLHLKVGSMPETAETRPIVRNQAELTAVAPSSGAARGAARSPARRSRHRSWYRFISPVVVIVLHSPRH